MHWNRCLRFFCHNRSLSLTIRFRIGENGKRFSNASFIIHPWSSFCSTSSSASNTDPGSTPAQENPEPEPLWFKSKLKRLQGDELTEAIKHLSPPPWRHPVGKNSRESKPLYLTNSLTRKKERFVPENGNRVQWYICGPTVYDSAHMGHARSYISFDIVRRVLQDYFGYDVNYVMNITDIDDKIIKRARQRFLIEKYLNEDRPGTKFLENITAALTLVKEKSEAETNADKRLMYQNQIAKINNALVAMQDAVKRDNARHSQAKHRLLEESRDALAEWLDSHFGASVIDHSIFNSLSRKYESEFFQDMAALHVRLPDIVTRVSEYVPEIITFVQRILENGFAYESGGSVYFDTAAFSGSGKHYFPKLMPEMVENVEESSSIMREGEGELAGDHAQDKRSQSDFALWKASKPGEPYWESPWGRGRPGWHIECSAMASTICGPVLDIHAGGFDLKFPHHDNELAQSEAHFDDSQWVNYFLHAGTLKIAGLKMSKSLKNFITIKDALKEYTPRQLRLVFLFHPWAEAMDYNHSTMAWALQFEKTSNEFFLSVKHYSRLHFKKEEASSFAKFGDEELELNEKFTRAKDAVDDALRDSIDTRMAVEALRALISQCNAYIAASEAKRAIPNCLLLRNVAFYVTRMLKIFGVIDDDDQIGFGSDQHVSDASKERLVTPYLEALCAFRERVRKVGKEQNLDEILAECDRLRDELLPELGVRLEDRLGHTMVKMVDRETLLKQREQERKLAEPTKLEKEKKRAAIEAKKAQRRVPPSEMFLKETDKYSRFDEKGVPTHDAKGEEIPEKLRKKLQKQYDYQERMYRRYLASVKDQDDH